MEDHSGDLEARTSESKMVNCARCRASLHSGTVYTGHDGLKH